MNSYRNLVKITQNEVKMDDFADKLLKILLKVMGLFPTLLPHKGLLDFDTFCNDIFYTYDLPDNPSYRNAIATMIMHLGPTVAYKSKFYFAIAVKKAMANQIAYEKIQQLKKDEAEYIKKTEFKADESQA